MMFKEFNRVHDIKEIVHVCMNMQNLIKANPWQYKPVLVTTESVNSYIQIKT